MTSKKTRLNGFFASVLLSTSFTLYAFPTEPIDDICGPKEPPAYLEAAQEGAPLKEGISSTSSKQYWFSTSNCGSVGAITVGVSFTVSSNLPLATRCTYGALEFKGTTSHSIKVFSWLSSPLVFNCNTLGVIETVKLPIQVSPIAAPTLSKR